MQNLVDKTLRIIGGWFAVFGVLFVCIFGVKLLPSKIAVEDNSNYKTLFYKIDEYVDGSFIAKYNNLSRIDVLFKNPNLESRDELKIVVKNDNKEIYSQYFSGFNFGDTSYARLDFSKISDSAGKKIKVEIDPVKIADGKLSFGVKNSKINMVAYYNSQIQLSDLVRSSIDIICHKIFVLPFIFVTILLW